MITTTCAYCGVPFKTWKVSPAATKPVANEAASATQQQQPQYCCIGCAMLARVPVDEKGQFPVNTHLISALVVGFLYFNQLLCWLLGVLLAQQQKLTQSDRFFCASAGLAIVVWGAVACVQWREKTFQRSDVIALLIVVGAHIWATHVFSFSIIPTLWLMALTNVLLIGWSMRGILRRAQKNRRKSSGGQL